MADNPFDNPKSKGKTPPKSTDAPKASGGNPFNRSKAQPAQLPPIKNMDKGPSSFVLRALDVLDRPVQGVKGFIAPEKNTDFFGNFKNAWAGLSGKKKTTAQALDPTTYLSFGTTGAAKVGLQQTAKTLGKTVAEDVVKLGAKKALTPVQRQTLRAALASAEGGSEKAATKVMRALDRGGRGGVKVAGRTVVPGRRLTAVTKPAAALNRAVRGTKAAEAIIPRAAIETKFGGRVAEDIGAAASRARSAANNATGGTVDRLMRSAKAAKVTTDELRDIVMPAMNGRKLAEEATARMPGLKVVFTTGFTRNAVVHNGVLDHDVHFLAKPFTIDQLAAKLRDVLDREK